MPTTGVVHTLRYLTTKHRTTHGLRLGPLLLLYSDKPESREQAWAGR
jgi:hypothetical protein